LPCAIVYVPGKSPKPPPAIHRNYLWRCLQRGVARHDPGAVSAVQACRFTLAGWNFLYYQRHSSLVDDVPWIERLIRCDGASDKDIKQARHWSKSLTKLMYALGDHAQWAIPWIPDPRIKRMMRDTVRYFENSYGVAGRIRGIVKSEIRKALAANESLCVIGHSMGSVIAYEALWELTHEEGRPVPVDLFLTLGSPVGMHYVQSRLLGMRDGSGRYPHAIGRWVNVSAVGDLVSVDECVSDDFAPMVERGMAGEIVDYHRDVYTAFRNEHGLNPHRSFGYLVHPIVGRAVANWCCGERA